MIIDGTKLTQIRVWRNLTRKQVSALTEIDEAKLMRYEKISGVQVPREHLDLLFEALNINIRNISKGD